MSKFFSSLFSSFSKHASPMDKALKNTCFIKDNFEEIEYDDLLKLLQFLLGKTETKQSAAIQEFFVYLKDHAEMSLQKRLKFLALIHKSVKKVGFEFAEEFLASKPNCLRERPVQPGKTTKQKQVVFHYLDIENWLEEYLIKHYYDYLMRMSLNLETYRACLQGEKEMDQRNVYGTMTNGQGGTNNALKIIILFKVNNIVNFVIKLQKQFYIIFTEFKFIAIAKDIAYMVLKDCVTYYNFMHRQIMTMVTNYESMLENDQMQFYELFIELIKLNSTLHDFCKLKKFFDEDNSIDQPLVLNITKERARQIDRNHRKIILKNEEIQRDRKLKLQQQQNQNKNDPSQPSHARSYSSTTHGKRLSFFPKQGSMTQRGLSWKPNEQICEVTNDDEEDENTIANNFKINAKKGTLAQGQAHASNALVPALQIENLYGGFNTDRVTYLRKDSPDDKSESTKETKKDDTFNNKKEIQE